jgi:hypothetical protein
VLSNNPSLQEILWNFSRFNDEKKRLTLKENPHFYAELPNLPETDWAGVKIDPIEDFRHANNFYVLTDKPEPVHIMTDKDSQWQSFGNFWCPKNAITFKGLGILFVCFSFFSDVLPDTRGRLRGERVVKESLRDTCWFCERLPASIIPRTSRSTLGGSYKKLLASAVPKASTNRRGLQPIITEGCSWMGWKCSTGLLPMHGSVDVGLGICTGKMAPDSPVRRDVIGYLPASVNTDIASRSLATNV